MLTVKNPVIRGSLLTEPSPWHFVPRSVCGGCAEISMRPFRNPPNSSETSRILDNAPKIRMRNHAAGRDVLVAEDDVSLCGRSLPPPSRRHRHRSGSRHGSRSARIDRDAGDVRDLKLSVGPRFGDKSRIKTWHAPLHRRQNGISRETSEDRSALKNWAHYSRRWGYPCRKCPGHIIVLVEHIVDQVEAETQPKAPLP
jgi:hypothetical protein